MKFSASKFHWMSWIAVMLRRLRKGDVHGVANVIAQCLPALGSKHPAAEQRLFERMIRHPELEGRHWAIWSEMKALLVPQAHSWVRKLLLEAGWKIRPEDKVAQAA